MASWEIWNCRTSRLLKSGLRVDGANSVLAWEDESEGPASLTRGAYSGPPSFRRLRPRP